MNPDNILSCISGIGSDSVRFNLPNQRKAISFTQTYGLNIAAFIQEWGLSNAFIEYPGCKNPITVPSINHFSTTTTTKNAMQNLTMGIMTAPIKLSEPLLRLFLDEFLPYPDRRMTLTQQDTHQQVAVSEAIMSQVKRPGVKLEDLVKRTDYDFCYWSDIEQADTDCKLLTPNNLNSSAIVTRRVHDTTGQNWRAMDFEIRLVEDAWGTIYQFKTGLDVRSCSMPVFYEEEN